MSVVIFDNDLAPDQIAQPRKDVRAKVLDRTEVILDIFATAQDPTAHLQVERTRALSECATPLQGRSQTHRGRGRGGMGTCGGAGEKQLGSKFDRRLSPTENAQPQREARQDPIDAGREVAGHGKTPDRRPGWLHQRWQEHADERLTGCDVLVADQLFATLDTQHPPLGLGRTAMCCSRTPSASSATSPVSAPMLLRRRSTRTSSSTSPTPRTRGSTTRSARLRAC